MVFLKVEFIEKTNIINETERAVQKIVKKFTNDIKKKFLKFIFRSLLIINKYLIN